MSVYKVSDFNLETTKSFKAHHSGEDWLIVQRCLRTLAPGIHCLVGCFFFCAGLYPYMNDPSSKTVSILIAFSLVGLAAFFGGAFYLLTSRKVRIDKSGLFIHHSILGVGRDTKIDWNKIVDFNLVQVYDTPYGVWYNITAILEEGQARTIFVLIDNQDEIQWLLTFLQMKRSSYAGLKTA